MAKSLAYDPSSVLEKSNLTTRVTKLVGVLRRNQVSTKATLTAMFQSEDKEFLLDALQPWYKGGRSKIETLIKNLWQVKISVSKTPFFLNRIYDKLRLYTIQKRF